MTKPNLHVVLADDDTHDCLLFKDALEEISLSTKLTTFADGDQLMKFLNNAPVLPDVLFLDLNMPLKNGYQCLEEIKNNPKFEQLPVIIFSTFYEPTIADKLYKNGARYYICKPPDFSRLTNVIHIALMLIVKAPDLITEKEVFYINDLKKMLFEK
jgi:response regulator RpfG family c-di-GMP phosphodiesterase